MENMTFYDFTTFVTNFAGVRFLFQNLFHSFLKHRKNYDFYDLKWPYSYLTQDFRSLQSEKNSFRTVAGTVR